jgi:hypothetical protein
VAALLSGTSAATFVVILAELIPVKKRNTNLVADMSVFTDSVQSDDSF